ncbi:hypothetical protein [Streptomyces boncukensis]|uniref:Uncharacterized protein n=1 Tax=Streptomyces boncukensis TaxID=2711219 RepID=A0A6G4X8M8_9ACTN|nr:hypothetical protein [Streptomyces boncukensis]NGO73210.1 hypothetical protein [Streptomyces boncukensis]
MARNAVPVRRRARHQAAPPRAVPRRAVPLAVLAVLAVLALGAAPGQAPPRGEKDPVATVRVTPSAVAPGGRLDLSTGACDGQTGAVAYADAFEKDVGLKPEADGDLAGRARIRSSAASGTHTVTVDCTGRPGAAEGEFTVAAPASPSGTPSPTAPVRAGGGGTADEHEDAGGGSVAGGGAVFGVALLAAFGVYLLRRRRASGSLGDG